MVKLGGSKAVSIQVVDMYIAELEVVVEAEVVDSTIPVVPGVLDWTSRKETANRYATDCTSLFGTCLVKPHCNHRAMCTGDFDTEQLLSNRYLVVA